MGFESTGLESTGSGQGSGNRKIVPFSGGSHRTATVPGSKSITNRALILAALTAGDITIRDVLLSDDTRIGIECLRRLGIPVEVIPIGPDCRVGGNGRIEVASADLFVGNAGTVARFLPAILAIASCGRFRIDGTEEMRRRPVAGLFEALASLGTSVRWLGRPGFYPLEMETGGSVETLWEVDASKSSQILSALLMAAPRSPKPTRVRLCGSTVSWPFVDMTVQMMKAFGAIFRVDRSGEFEIEPTGYRMPEGSVYEVEPDATAASYFLVLPLTAGGSVQVNAIGQEGLQGDRGFTEVLEKAGFGIEWNERGVRSHWGGSSILDRPPDAGRMEVFDFNAISDTFLTLAAIAPLLPFRLRIEGIGHTRLQECDRIEAMAHGLRLLHQRVVVAPEALEVHPDPEGLRRAAVEGVSIPTWRDHRVAMSFSILGSADPCGNGQPWLTIEDPNCVAKTFPDFFDRLESLRKVGLS